MLYLTPKEFEYIRAFWERRASATSKLPTDINRLPAEQSIKWEDYCCERYVISKGTYKSPTKTAILTPLQTIGRYHATDENNDSSNTLEKTENWKKLMEYVK